MDIKLEIDDNDIKKEFETNDEVWFEVPIVPADMLNDFKDDIVSNKSNNDILASKNKDVSKQCMVKCEFPENTAELSYTMKKDEEKLPTKKSYSKTNVVPPPSIDKIKPKTFVCGACFNVNLNPHTAKDVPKCEQCGSESTKPHPDAETQTESRAKAFKCDQCYFKSASASVFERHKTSHSGVTTFKCHLCGFQSSYAGIIEQHKQSHAARPFKCNKCSYTSSRVRYLELHETKHTGNLPFKCNKCPYQGIHLYLIEKHTVKYHAAYPNDVVVPKTSVQRVREYRARKRAERLAKSRDSDPEIPALS